VANNALARARRREAVNGPPRIGDKRAARPDIKHVRVSRGWLRYSDRRPDSFIIAEFELP
jgi:hypothetical protein